MQLKTVMIGCETLGAFIQMRILKLVNNILIDVGIGLLYEPSDDKRVPNKTTLN